MTKANDVWGEAAWRAEGPVLRDMAARALEAPPSAVGLRDLAVGAAALEGLTPEQGLRAVERVRWGLASDDHQAEWDAVHVAGELGLAPLQRDLAAILDAPRKHEPTVRARAAEAYAETAAPNAAAERLTALQQDDAWTVRRLAADALRLLGAGQGHRGSLFGRLEALIRCGRVRLEADDAPLETDELARLGLRVPPSYLLFFQRILPGGRLVYVEDAGKKSKERDGDSLFLTSPQRLGEAGGAVAADLLNANEYVWARYVEGARSYPKLDEDYALRRYAERYDRMGRVDADAWNYGVLLFESAFRDEAHRERLLLACRDVLWAYKLLAPEEWDVVDDRLAEAEDIVAQEGLTWRGEESRRPLPIGRWRGVAELCLDLEAPGVFARDADASPQLRRVAPCPTAFLAAPSVAERAAADDQDPLELLARVEGHIDAGRKREAARLFCEVLEEHDAPLVLERAARILVRDGMTALDAAQLLSIIPLAGDRRSNELTRELLQALSPEAAAALIQAAAPYNEDKSQIAQLINAAANIRKRTHADVKALAKQLRETRQAAHIRTIRNPWYKK